MRCLLKERQTLLLESYFNVYLLSVLVTLIKKIVVLQIKLFFKYKKKLLVRISFAFTNQS